MKKHRVLRKIAFAMFVIVACFLFGLVVMSLWNWLMPTLFGLRVVSYWQALGLLVLSRILLGGFRGHGPSRGHRWRRVMERWEHMTPEEREKFRQSLRTCSDFPPPVPEPKP
jgi:hypothetical protein